VAYLGLPESAWQQLVEADRNQVGTIGGTDGDGFSVNLSPKGSLNDYVEPMVDLPEERLSSRLAMTIFNALVLNLERAQNQVTDLTTRKIKVGVLARAPLPVGVVSESIGLRLLAREGEAAGVREDIYSIYLLDPAYLERLLAVVPVSATVKDQLRNRVQLLLGRWMDIPGLAGFDSIDLNREIAPIRHSELQGLIGRQPVALDLLEAHLKSNGPPEGDRTYWQIVQQLYSDLDAAIQPTLNVPDLNEQVIAFPE
jgi:hypothetical protein